MSFLTYISPMRNVNALLTGRWFSKSVVRVPEDQPKIDEAVEIARRGKADPMSYDSPMSLIEAFKKYKLREGAVNPDTVPELSNKREIGYGITVYDVDDPPEGQFAMRRIVDTHFGEDANPWCLLQGDGEGGVTDDAWDYWQHYDGCEKKVAFENGKLIAFCANEDYDDLWWDRQDKSHDGVPLLNYLIPDDELGRSADLEIGVCGDIVEMSDIYKGNRQNGLYEEWYENGQLWERSNWKDGQEDGLYEGWHPNGQLANRCTYKEGYKDGLCEGWYDNNQLHERCHYNDGRREGLSERWYEDGRLAFRGTYKNGKPVGLFEKWYDNGQLLKRYNCKNGQYDGLFESWHKNGQIEERSSWREDKKEGLSEHWFEDGSPWIRSHWKNGRQEGLKERWYPNGRLEERSNWKNGKRDGLYEEWKRDGQLTERYNWKNGRRDGLCEHWHDNGQLSFRANYKEDKFDGLYERWHPNGQLFEQSNYNNGLEDGLYEKWRSNGQMDERSHYKDGELDGLCEILRLDMKVDAIIYDMGKEVSRQVLNDFTPVDASIQAGKKEKQLNILSPKRKGGRGL